MRPARRPLPERGTVPRRAANSWSSIRLGVPPDVTRLGHCQKAPLQRLVLSVLLAQRQRRGRLAQLVAQVESVERVEGSFAPIAGDGRRLPDQLERITAGPVAVSIKQMDRPVLDHDPVIRISDATGDLVKLACRHLDDLW